MTRRVVAVVDDADGARRLVERLSLAGYDGRDLRVEDPAGDGRPSRRVDRATDANVVRRLAERALAGGGIGLLLGLGAVLVTRLLDGPALPWPWLVAAFSGGAVLGLVATPVMAPAWEDANTPGPGVRRVIVDRVDDHDVARVRRILGEHARQVWVETDGDRAAG